MKQHKLPKEIIEKMAQSKQKIDSVEAINTKLKLNLAQLQMSLMRNVSEIEIQKALTEGMIQGFAISKKLNIDDVKLSEDGLSIITNE